VSIFGQMDGEEWIEWLKVARSQMPDVRSRIVCIHRLEQSGGVVALDYTGHDTHGGEVSVPFVSVVIIDPDAGTLNRFEVFDPENLDAALARFSELIANHGDTATSPDEAPPGEVGPFDEAYEATLAPAEVEVWRANQQFVRTYNERDWEALRALLDPDAVIVDERMTGWGRVDREQFLVHLGDLVGLVGDARVKIAAVHVISPSGVAVRFEVTGTVPGGGEFEMDFEAAMTVERALIVGLYLLPDGDVAGAIRRLD
jgi:hypothetical protein